LRRVLLWRLLVGQEGGIRDGAQCHSLIAVPLRMQQKREERQVKIKLGDAPGAADLVARLVAATSDMALAFVGEPDEKVRAHLERRRDGFERKLAEEIGAGTAREIVPVLFGAVLAEKARLERNWGGARN
jgi:hypothetical protein